MNKELRMRLEAGLDEMAPKLLDRILEQEIRPIGSEAELFGEELNMSMPPVKKAVWRGWYGLAVAAVFALLFCFGEVQANNVIEGQIIVDVNPSVALSVNKAGRVRNVEALNADGVSIVDGVSRKKGNIETVLESVFASLETQDYLKSEKAGVLVSYCYEKESAAVETKIQSAIVNLSGSRQNCTIYSQTFARENDEEEKARTAGVSVGKYYFVNRIKEDANVSEEVSYDKTMEEIVQIMDDQGVQVAGVEVYTAGNSPMVCMDTELPGTESEAVQTTENSGEPSGNSPETPGEADSGDIEHPVVELPDTGKKPGHEIPGTEIGSENPGTEIPDTEDPGSKDPGTEISDTENSGSEVQDTEEPGSEVSDTENPGSEIQDTEEPGSEAQDTENSGTEMPDQEANIAVPVLEWVKAEYGEDKKVHVTWDSPENASGYEIYYRNTSRKDYEKIAENVTGNSCAISGLIPGRSYLFRIVPYLVVSGEKHYGEGQISDTVELVLPGKADEDSKETGGDFTEPEDAGDADGNTQDPEDTEDTEEGTQEDTEDTEEGIQDLENTEDMDGSSLDQEEAGDADGSSSDQDETIDGENGTEERGDFKSDSWKNDGETQTGSEESEVI